MSRPATSLPLPHPPVAQAPNPRLSPAAASGPASRLARRFEGLLATADVRLVARGASARPWDIQVADGRLARRVLVDGALGLGDAYVEGWWECDDLPELFCRLLRHDLPARLIDRHQWALVAWQTLTNAHRRKAAFANGQDHYDRGNALFEAMLDRRMTYTCGYWGSSEEAEGEVAGRTGADSLDAAQEAKLEMSCRKLRLKPGDRVLDIGCGWGSFARYAAERYGARVVGVTVAKEQLAWARESCRGLPCEFRLQDYRDIPAGGERFDHVVSLGMFEHVGHRNHRTYMQTVAKVLKPAGLFLLHTISTRRSQPNAKDTEISWMDRHIFPGLCIPSLAQVGRAIDGLFVIEDLHNFGVHYERTLLAWFANFDRNWPTLRGRYGERAERFYRMWKYYLQICAGAFRSRKYGVWQMVLSPAGVVGGYERPN